MKRKTPLILAIVLLMAYSANSQTTTTVRDLETWTAVGVSKKLNDQFKLNLEQHLRLYDNTSKVDQYFTEFSVRYKPKKFIYLSGGIRYIRDRDKGNDSYENHLRFNGDLGFKHDANRFSFDYRIRFQTKNELGFSGDEGDYLRNKFRLKAEVGYDIKNWKLDPEVSAELFRTSGKYEVSQFEKYRITIGTSYKFKKLGKLGVFYRLERELQGVSYPKTTNIIGVKMMFEL